MLKHVLLDPYLAKPAAKKIVLVVPVSGSEDLSKYKHHFLFAHDQSRCSKLAT